MIVMTSRFLYYFLNKKTVRALSAQFSYLKVVTIKLRVFYSKCYQCIEAK